MYNPYDYYSFYLGPWHYDVINPNQPFPCVKPNSKGSFVGLVYVKDEDTDDIDIAEVELSSWAGGDCEHLTRHTTSLIAASTELFFAAKMQEMFESLDQKNLFEMLEYFGWDKKEPQNIFISKYRAAALKKALGEHE